MVYAAVHGMKLHDPVNACMVKTHMLVIDLEPAPSGQPGDFVYKYAGVHETGDPQYGHKEAVCAALAENAEDEEQRHLAMYVRSGKVGYLAPIGTQRGAPLQFNLRYGPPDNDWKRFLERAINKTLKEEDRSRIHRLQLGPERELRRFLDHFKKM